MNIFQSEAQRSGFFKMVRIVLILFIFGVVDVLLYRHFFQIESYNGFTNSALHTIYPTQSGYLSLNPSLEEGDLIRSGAVIGHLESSLEDPKNNSLNKIITPASGVVLAIHQRSGEYLQPNRPILQIASCDHQWADVFVNEKDVSKIDTTKPVHIKVLSNLGHEQEGEAITGTIKFIRHSIQPEQMVSVEQFVPSPEKQGMSILSSHRSDSDKSNTLSQVMGVKPFHLQDPIFAWVRVTLPENKSSVHNPQQFCGIGNRVKAVFSRHA
ncbi:MAG: HlyD family secretion protein [Cyanobacteria bacterium]|nr:HlyD family secretion protein [Cyanobacteriota bacterium]